MSGFGNKGGKKSMSPFPLRQRQLRVHTYMMRSESWLKISGFAIRTMNSECLGPSKAWENNSELFITLLRRPHNTIASLGNWMCRTTCGFSLATQTQIPWILSSIGYSNVIGGTSDEVKHLKRTWEGNKVGRIVSPHIHTLPLFWCCVSCLCHDHRRDRNLLTRCQVRLLFFAAFSCPGQHIYVYFT